MKSLALYPTPLVVVGTMVNGKPNYVLVGHVGIIGHDRIMVSLAKPHYTNQGIKETRALTVNIVDEGNAGKKQTGQDASAEIRQISRKCLLTIQKEQGRRSSMKRRS